jgi:hypothetical protein
MNLLATITSKFSIIVQANTDTVKIPSLEIVHD